MCFLSEVRRIYPVNFAASCSEKLRHQIYSHAYSRSCGVIYCCMIRRHVKLIDILKYDVAFPHFYSPRAVPVQSPYSPRDSPRWNLPQSPWFSYREREGPNPVLLFCKENHGDCGKFQRGLSRGLYGDCTGTVETWENVLCEHVSMNLSMG